MDSATLRTWFARNRVLLAIVLIAGGLYALGPIAGSSPAAFSSPDEMVNYRFAQRVGENGRIWFPEPGNTTAVSVIGPRNTIPQYGRIVPGGFLGMPFWYGTFNAVTRIPLVTLAIGVALGGVVALFLIARTVFGEGTARRATLLLLLLTPYWYLTLRPFTQQLAFVAFFLMGIACALRFAHRPSLLRATLAAALLGIASTMRYNELIWVLPLASVGLWRMRRLLTPTVIAGLVGGWAIAWLPILALHHGLYGNWFETGYLSLSDEPLTGTLQSLRVSGQSVPHVILTVLLPFGFDAGLLLTHIGRYLGTFLPWWALFGTMGIVGAMRRPRTARVRTYGVLLLLVAGFQVIATGSGKVFGAATEYAGPILGASFVRYWLLVYVGFLPFVAEGMRGALMRLSSSFVRASAVVVLIAFVVVQALTTVIGDPAFGTAQLRRDAEQHLRHQVALRQYVRPADLVVAGAFDKELFPAFRVIGYGRFRNPQALVLKLAPGLERQNVYWLLADPDERRSLQGAAAQAGAHFVRVATIDQQMILYRLERLTGDAPDAMLE
ncbi:MAG: glycosyltransferase family 39 protein [Candidatus Kerfeldbacteria bacterium]|nr:glycosyltransferase family 39 protein [Candidatus Kerfeldbacteria bacterium]